MEHRNNIDSKLTNYRKTDFGLYNLQFVEEQSSRKAIIYNGEFVDKLQKIWLKIPTIKAFKPHFKPYHKTSTPLTLLLSPIEDPEIKKFKSYIKKLEKAIKGMLIEKDKSISKLSFKSCLNKTEPFPYHMVVNLPFTKDGECHEYNFNIYDNNCRRISPDKIDTGTFVDAFICLSYVWISDIKFGLHFDVLQMKLTPEFNFNECLFVEEYEEKVKAEEEKKKIESQNECFHCLYCPNSYGRTHMCNGHNNRNYGNRNYGHEFIEGRRELEEPVHNYVRPKTEKPNNNGMPANPMVRITPQLGDILSVKLKSTKNNSHDSQKPKGSKVEKRSNAYGGFVPSLGDLLRIKDSLGKRNTLNKEDYDKVLNEIENDNIKISKMLDL